MKQLIVAALISFIVLVPNIGAAEGEYKNYGVLVSPGNFIFGSFNNRFDTAATTFKTYIGGNYNTSSKNVTFYGRGSDGSYFSCYVPPSSSFYQFAYDTVQNMESTALTVSIAPNSSECSQVVAQKESSFQH